MRNYVQDGDVLSLTAPYAVSSGGGFLVGSIFAVAVNDAASAASVQGHTRGVFTLKAEGAASGQDLTVGTAVYWDNTNKQCTKTATDNTKIGVATAAKASTDTLVTVRLNGSF